MIALIALIALITGHDYLISDNTYIWYLITLIYIYIGTRWHLSLWLEAIVRRTAWMRCRLPVVITRYNPHSPQPIDTYIHINILIRVVVLWWRGPVPYIYILEGYSVIIMSGPCTYIQSPSMTLWNTPRYIKYTSYKTDSIIYIIITLSSVRMYVYMYVCMYVSM